jgi:hypothetical protein
VDGNSHRLDGVRHRVPVLCDLGGEVIAVILPLHTINQMNGTHHHWRTVSSRRKRERGTAAMLVRNQLVRNGIKPPAVVTITRLSAGDLDDDGLRSALKSVRDGIADAFGVDDSAKSPLRFEYQQERCKRGAYAVRVEIVPVAAPVAPTCWNRHGIHDRV